MVDNEKIRRDYMLVGALPKPCVTADDATNSGIRGSIGIVAVGIHFFNPTRKAFD